MPTWEMACGDTGAATGFTSGPKFSAVAGALVSASGSSEAAMQCKVYSSYTWANLYVRCTVMGASTTTTIRSRIGGSFGNQTATVDATGVFQDTTNSDSLVSGNLINWEYDRTAGAGTQNYTIWGSTLKGTTSNITLELVSTTPTVFAASITRYICIGGRLINNASQGATTESDVQYTIRRATTYSNLRVVLAANTVNGDSTWTSRIDTGGGPGAGNQTVTLTNSTSGAFEDTTNTDIVAVGDKINHSLTTGGSSGSLQPTLCQLKHVSVGRETATGNPFGISLGADGYFGIEGKGQSSATQSDSQVAARAAFTAKNLFVNLIVHTGSGTIDFYIQQNNNNSAVTVRSSGTTTGIFEDTTNQVSIAVADTYNFFGDLGAGVVTCTPTIIGMEQGPADAISAAGGVLMRKWRRF